MHQGTGRFRRIAVALAVGLAGGLIAASSASALSPLGQFGSSGTGDGQFNDSFGIATDLEGNVWLPDADGNRLLKFRADGTFLLAVGWGVRDGTAELQTCTTGCQSGIPGAGAGQFMSILYAATDTAGNVYVTDADNERVSVFSRTGTFLRQWGSPGSAEGETAGIAGIAVDGRGRVYVAEETNDRIQRFSPTGTSPVVFGFGVQNGAASYQTCSSGCQAGISGPGDGQFDDPVDVGVGMGGNLYVVDKLNDRIQMFRPDLSLIGEWGVPGTAGGQLGGPSGLDFTRTGLVYVAEEGNDRVQRFSATGDFQLAFGWGVRDGTAEFQTCTSGCQAGISGNGSGQFDGTEDLAVDCRGNVYVPDYVVLRVQKFGEPGAGDPPCSTFGLGKVRRNRNRGTAVLTVNIPGPGTLALGGRGVRPRPLAQVATFVTSGKVKLVIRPKRRIRTKLRTTGRARVRARVTYTPTGGTAKKRFRTIRLLKR